MSRLFFSHKASETEDRILALKIVRILENENYGGHDVFLSSDPLGGVRAGYKWENQIYAELRRRDAVIFLCTEKSKNSEWCFAELILARSQKVPIFEIRSKTDVGHKLLSEEQSICLEEQADEISVVSIINEWLANLGAIETPGKWPLGKCPYPGLDSFTEDWQAVFFGRMREVENIIIRINDKPDNEERRLLTIIGAAGVGKSSLVRAGVIPRLRCLPAPNKWLIIEPFRPGKAPIINLAEALIKECRAQFTVFPPSDTIAFLLEKNPLECIEKLLNDLGKRNCPNIRKFNSILITIDQFEELLTECNPSESAVFLKILDKIASKNYHIWTLITLRAEFAGLDGVGNILTDFLKKGFDRIWLFPPSEEDITQLITEPATMAGADVDPQLVAKIAQDLFKRIRKEALLPLLSLTLRNTWEEMEVRTLGQQSVVKKMLIADYKNARGVSGAVAKCVDKAVRHLSRSGKNTHIVDVLGRFATFTANGDGPFRRRVSEFKENEYVIVNAFEKVRLIRQAPSATGVYEFTHESIFDSYADLKKWIETNKENLILLSQIRAKANFWKANPTEPLLHGELLRKALDIRTFFDEKNLEEFVAESLKASQRFQLIEQRKNYIKLAQSISIYARQELFINPMNSLSSVIKACIACNDEGDMEPPSNLQAALYESIITARELWKAGSHWTSVRRIVISKDCSRVASGGGDGLIRLWNTKNGEEYCSPLSGHRAGISALTFASNSDTLISASFDESIRIWSLKNQTIFDYNVEHDVITQLVHIPDLNGSRIAAVTESGMLLLYGFNGEIYHKIMAHKAFISSCAYSESGEYIVTVAGDGTIGLWDRNLNSITEPWPGHDDAISDVDISPDGRFFATGGRDGVIHIWTKEGKPAFRPITEHDSYITTLRFSPTGKILFVGLGDGILKQWRIDGRIYEKPFKCDHISICSIDVSSDGRFFTTGGLDQNVRSYDTRGLHTADPINIGSDPVNVVLIPKDDLLLTCRDNTIAKYSFDGKRIGETWKGHSQIIWAMANSPSGSVVISGSTDGEVCYWNLNGDLIAGPFKAHDAEVTAIRFAADSSTIFTASRDGTIGLWNEKGSPIKKKLKLKGSIRFLDTLFQKGENLILYGGYDSLIHIINMKGETISEFPAHDPLVRWAVFVPDVLQIASGGPEGELCLWKFNGEAIGKSMRGHTDYISMVAADKKSDLIVTAGADGVVRFWMRDCTPIEETRISHPGGAWTISFSPKGNFLASGGNDGTVLLWRTGTWQDWFNVGKLRLEGHFDTIGTKNFEFSPQKEIKAP